MRLAFQVDSRFLTAYKLKVDVKAKQRFTHRQQTIGRVRFGEYPSGAWSENIHWRTVIKSDEKCCTMWHPIYAAWIVKSFCKPFVYVRVSQRGIRFMYCKPLKNIAQFIKSKSMIKRLVNLLSTLITTARCGIRFRNYKSLESMEVQQHHVESSSSTPIDD